MGFGGSRRLVTAAGVLCFVQALAGCSGDDGGGAEPRIRDLEYSPSTDQVGSGISLSGQYWVSDTDGDVVEGVFEISRPNGDVDPEILYSAPPELRPTDTMLFRIPFTGFEAGRHVVTIWVRDATGNESNRLGAVIDVAE